MKANLIDFKNNYEITENGTVKNRFGRPLMGFISKRGYKSFNLSNKGKFKTIPLHRLLAEKFIPNPENKCCINHKDGNKLNNNLSNLEWCTYKENLRHAIDNNLNKIDGMKGVLGKYHPRSKPVFQLVNGEYIKHEGVHSASRKTGIDFRKISKQALNKNNKNWQYEINT